jgi:hypothetical protein
MEQTLTHKTLGHSVGGFCVSPAGDMEQKHVREKSSIIRHTT